MCRKLKVNEDDPVYLKHYKNGEFHKDYDRKTTTSSLINFMRDPSGGIPWEEDPSATDVVHLPDPDVLNFCDFYINTFYAGRSRAGKNM